MSSSERRINPRYPLRTFATLTSPSATANPHDEWAVHLLDISAQGARIALLDEHKLMKGDLIELRIEVPQLNDAEASSQYIQLSGKVVHRMDHLLGVEYEPKSPVDFEDLCKLLETIA